MARRNISCMCAQYYKWSDPEAGGESKDDCGAATGNIRVGGDGEMVALGLKLWVATLLGIITSVRTVEVVVDGRSG